MSTHEVTVDVVLYIDGEEKVNRTGKLKYYDPLLLGFMKAKTLSFLDQLDETVPVGISETIPENAANAIQIRLNI